MQYLFFGSETVDTLGKMAIYADASFDIRGDSCSHTGGLITVTDNPVSTKDQ